MKAEWTNNDSLTTSQTTKAILVIDMPKSCGECPLRTSLEANYLYCIATLPRLKIDPMTAHIIKEHKCPLKPMPQPKGYIDAIEWHLTEKDGSMFTDGWNDCINAIIGDTDGTKGEK